MPYSASLDRAVPAAPISILEHEIGDLIRGYVRGRTDRSAQLVVRQLEALCAHPEVCRDAERFCAYRRLMRHWRWLAAHRASSGEHRSSAGGRVH